MKICIINNLYPPYARGGAEQVVHTIVDGLLLAGHTVVLITTSPKGDWITRDGALTIYRSRPKNVFFYTVAHKYSFFWRMVWHGVDMFHIGYAKYVSSILLKEKPDVVHTHNLMGMSFLIPREIRALGIPHVHTAHDVQLVEPSGVIYKTKENSWRYNGMPTRLYVRFMKWLMGSPSTIVIASQFLVDFYQSRGFFPHSNMVVLRNPMTMTTLQNAVLPMRGVVDFLYVGQIEKHKGIQFLVESFLAFSSSQSRLHVVGDGSLLVQLQEKTKGDSRIVFHGRLDRKALSGLFQTMTITIVPSLCYENSPTVIFESLSSGVPVLASRIEGIAELIIEKENGLTFDAGDRDSLLEKLQWCIDHRDEVVMMSKNSARSVQGFSQQEYIQRLVSLYQQSKI